MELVVVCLLIAVLATLAVLRVDRDFDRIAEQEARRFMALVQHARDESVLAGRTYGIEVDEGERSYWFTRANPWKTLEGDSVLRRRTLPEPLTIEFKEFGLEDKDKERFGLDTDADDAEDSGPESGNGEDGAKKTQVPAAPPIIINALGEITPFVFTVIGENKRYNVDVNDDQELELASENEDRF